MAQALDHELEGLDRHLRGNTIPEGLDLERARLLLERARERGREADDKINRGRSLQHGHGLVQAVARGQHPALAWESGRRSASEGMGEEFQNRLRVRYLEQIMPRLQEVTPPAERE
jgi:hypothetical protein